MTDHFEHHASGFDAPATDAFDIVPSDAGALPTTTRALYIGIGGLLRVEMKGGGEVSFENVPDGALLPIRVTRVLEATDASAIVGLY
jgi:hypothetical protein